MCEYINKTPFTHIKYIHAPNCKFDYLIWHKARIWNNSLEGFHVRFYSIPSDFDIIRELNIILPPDCDNWDIMVALDKYLILK